MSTESAAPIRLLVDDDLQRSRLTVFFRLLLALPHIIWLIGWSLLAVLGAFLNWVITLFAGRSPDWLHGFLARYLRYVTHVEAYLSLAANPFPGFLGARGYPIDLEIAGPQRQNRWTVGFRALLALPALALSSTLAGGGFSIGRNSGSVSWSLTAVCAVLAWFVVLARGRTLRGLRDGAAYGLAYAAQAHGYVLLLTDRYPNSDPLAALAQLPERADPVALELSDDLRRSRLTVFFRLLLALVHIIWLLLWDIAALFVAFANWLVTLVRGSPPAVLHRFLSAYVRYRVHVFAYLLLIAEPFPGFVGRAGSYPVDLRIGAPERQNRWTVLFRWLLAIPALLVAATYGGVMTMAALLGWFASLFTARMPLGLRNTGALALRYAGQAHAYAYLLTSSYPYSGPTRQDGPQAAAPYASATS